MAASAGVGLARHLLQRDGLVSDPLLDPELTNREVAYAANPAPPADPNRRLGICAEGQGPGDAEVRRHGLHPQALGGPMDDAPSSASAELRVTTLWVLL